MTHPACVASKLTFSLACGLPDNFQTWFSVTHLHVWLLMVRIRAEKNGKVFQQQLVNHFFHDIEDRMRYNHQVWSSQWFALLLGDQNHSGKTRRKKCSTLQRDEGY